METFTGTLTFMHNQGDMIHHVNVETFTLENVMNLIHDKISHGFVLNGMGGMIEERMEGNTLFSLN